MSEILKQYRGKRITRKTAVMLVTKFLMQEGLLERFLAEIKKIKPYRKGNDDKKYLLSYAVVLSLGYASNLNRIFLLPQLAYEIMPEDDLFYSKTFLDKVAERDFWEKVNDKWLSTVGEELLVLPLEN